MTGIEKALLTKELSKASSALWEAFVIAARHGDLDFAKSLREQHKSVAAAITKVNGGPVKVSVAELLR